MIGPGLALVINPISGGRKMRGKKRGARRNPRGRALGTISSRKMKMAWKNPRVRSLPGKRQAKAAMRLARNPWFMSAKRKMKGKSKGIVYRPSNKLTPAFAKRYFRLDKGFMKKFLAKGGEGGLAAPMSVKERKALLALAKAKYEGKAKPKPKKAKKGKGKGKGTKRTKGTKAKAGKKGRKIVAKKGAVEHKRAKLPKWFRTGKKYKGTKSRSVAGLRGVFYRTPKRKAPRFVFRSRKLAKGTMLSRRNPFGMSFGSVKGFAKDAAYLVLPGIAIDVLTSKIMAMSFVPASLQGKWRYAVQAGTGLGVAILAKKVFKASDRTAALIAVGSLIVTAAKYYFTERPLAAIGLQGYSGGYSGASMGGLMPYNENPMAGITMDNDMDQLGGVQVLGAAHLGKSHLGRSHLST